MLPVLILAGGLATRLRPITETIPKALIEIAGEPFIYHQLRYLRSQGVTRVILSVGYLGEMIESLVGNEKKFDLEISVVYDGSTLLGTGGAVKKALPLLGESFFIQYGDSFLPVDFSMVQTAFMTSEKPALMTVLKNDNQWDKSNVIFENNQLLEYNKKIHKPQMNYIDYGLGVFAKEVFERYPVDGPFDLATVYSELSSKNMLAGFEVYERFYEIGSRLGIEQANDYFRKLK